MTAEAAPAPTPRKRLARPRDQLAVLRLCKQFLDDPKSSYKLQVLCEALLDQEMNARLRSIIQADKTAAHVRAEVKALEICRTCRVTLDAANRARVSGYQCLPCKRAAHARSTKARRDALRLTSGATPR